jgi:hypothetical protein
MAASKDEAGSRLRNRICRDLGVKSKGRKVNMLHRNILMLNRIRYDLFSGQYSIVGETSQPQALIGSV